MTGKHKIQNRMRMLAIVSLVLCGRIWSQEVAERGSPGRAEASRELTAAPGQLHDDSYLIGSGDVLSVNVWKEPDISRAVPVRSDGKISLPLAGEMQAGGVTPKQLEQDIVAHLKNYISDPEVTVVVQEMRSRKFNILGEVMKPGTYLLTDSTTILDAIAMAGGFRDFAKRKSIYVLRTKTDGTKEKLPFNYKQVIKGSNQSENVRLEPHDTVIVP